MSGFSKILIFSVFCLIGLALIPLLRLQYLPQSHADSISISWEWPGAGPDHIERYVTAVLEGNLALVKGIDDMTSVSQLNSGRIDVNINVDVNFEYTKYEIASKIRHVYPSLPEGVGYPIISDNIPDEGNTRRPILTYSINSDSDPAAIYEYLSGVVLPKLSFIDGVDKTEIVGYRGRELYLTLNDLQLERLGISRVELISILRSQIEDSGLGLIQDDDRSVPVILTSSIRQKLNDLPRLPSEDEMNELIGEILSIPISSFNGVVIRLKDVGMLNYTSRSASNYYRVNGRNSLRLIVYADDDANEIATADHVLSKMDELSLSFPINYEILLENDDTDYLREELRKVYERSMLALVVIVLFSSLTYRSWRYLLVICFSLLVNLGIASIFYYLLSIEIHLYALAGITISFGIVVDNAIVMAHHYRQTGDRSIFPALLTSTLTTIASLTIILFLPDIWQDNLKGFMQVIVINLMISLFVALFLVPLMIHANDRGSNKQSRIKRIWISLFNQYYSRLLHLLLRHRKWMIGGIILLFGLPIFLLPNRIEGWESYNNSIGSDWYRENVRPIVNRTLGGTLRLFSWYVYEAAYIGQPEETILYVNGRMPLGTTLNQINEVYIRLEKYLRQFDGKINQFTTRITSGQEANLIVKFNEDYNNTFPYQLKNQIERYCLGFGGVDWNVYGVGKGFSNSRGVSEPSYSVYMYGYNDSRLVELSADFAKILEKHPRVAQVDTEGSVNWFSRGLYAYDMILNQEHMAIINIDPGAVYQYLSKYHQGIHPNLYLTTNLPMRIKVKNLHRGDKWKMLNTPTVINDQSVRIGSLATMKKKKVANTIYKKNQQFLRICEFEYSGSARFGQQHLNKSMAEIQDQLPIGYSMEQVTYDYGGKESQKQYLLLLMVIGLIFFICAIHFESLRQAFAIVLLIPSSFIGIFITFYWFDFGFDQGGYISFIFLSGLVVNSIILLISEYNRLSHLHPNRRGLDIFVKAVNYKMSPILLTIVSTIVGLIPFLIHGPDEVFWFSLAVGTIGGLLFSIVVLLLFIPLFVVKR